MRRALAQAVRNDNRLRHTKDIVRQWQQLILGPVGVASQAIAAPVLIVIDALDGGGDAISRKRILRLLADKLDKFPIASPQSRPVQYLTSTDRTISRNHTDELSYRHF
jgi:hypothetical protein